MAEGRTTLTGGPRHYEWASDRSRLEINLPEDKRRRERAAHLFCSRQFAPPVRPRGGGKDYEAEKERLSERVQRIEDDINIVRMSADLASQENRLNALSCEIEECRRDSERINAAVAADDRIAHELRERVERLTESQKKLVDAISELRLDKQREIEREKENVRIGTVRISSLRQEVTDKECVLGRMKERVKTLKLDCETNRVTADGYRDANHALLDRIAGLARQLGECREEREVLEGLCRKRDALISSLKARLVAEGIDPDVAPEATGVVRARRQAMELELVRLRRDYADARQRVEERDIELRSLKDELAKSAEALRLAARVKVDSDDSVRMELRRLSESLEQAHKLRAEASAENEVVRRQARELQLARDVASRANSEMQDQVREGRRALDAALRRAHEAECAVAADKSKLDELVRARIALEDAVREERAAKEAAQATAARLGTELALATSQKDELSRQLRDLQEVAAQLRADLSASRAESLSLSERTARLERDKEDLSAMLERRAVEVADARRAAESERQAREASQQSVRESLALLDGERRVRVEAEDSRRALEARVAELQLKLERAEAVSSTRAEESARRHEEMLRELEAERARSAEIGGRLEGHLQLCARQREEAAERARDLEQQLAVARGRLAELEAFRSQAARLQERERVLSAELDDARAALNRFRARATELEGSQTAAAAAQRQCEELEAECSRLRSELARANARVAELERCERQLADALRREQDAANDAHQLRLQVRVATARAEELDHTRRLLAQCEERERKLQQEHAQTVSARDDAARGAASLERELAELRARDSESANRLLRAAADGDELRTLLESTKRERGALLERCKQMEEEVEAMTTKLERTQQRNAEITCELEVLRRSEQAATAAAEDHIRRAAGVARAMATGADGGAAVHARLVMSRVAALLDSIGAVAERLRCASEPSVALIDECCGAISAVCASGQEELSSHGTVRDVGRCEWCPDFEFLGPAIDAFERSREETRAYLDEVHGMIGGDPAEFIRAKAKVVELSEQVASLLLMLCRVAEIASSQMALVRARVG